VADALCSECIKDRFLREIVSTEGAAAHCDVCEQDRPHTITIDRLGELLEPEIRKHYRQGDQYPPDWDQEGDDLDFVVPEALGQDFEFNDQIIDAVIAAEYCDPRDGDIPFFEKGTNYVAIPASGSDLQFRWAYVQHELSTTHRFFSSAAEAFFEELFHDADSILSTHGTKEDRGVVTDLPTGFTVYRGRTCDGDFSEIFKDPYKEVGPPPLKFARAGRMNADGISIFYGATDKETCLAELRPAIGEESAVITLQTTKSLRMLDFTRMPTAYKSLSFFQPDFEEQAERLSFLRILGALISRPVVPGHESEYLITQTMMEYLAHVYRDPIERRSFDGVIFKSTQRDGGQNIVLFPQMKREQPTFPLNYVAGSLTIHATKGITYEHKEAKYRFDGETAQPEWDFGELYD
jgi:hypothetical protein